MPPVIIGAVVSGIIAGAIAGSLAIFATVFFTTLILGAISMALQPDLDFGEGSIPRNENVIQPITYRAVVYGESRVSGPIIFLDTTDENSRLHFIVPLAGHEVEEIGNIFFDGEHVPLDGSGDATGKYAGLVRIKKHLGTSSQAADPDLVAESSFWTTAHQGLDVAYIYIRLIFNAKKFSRIPNVTAMVKGKKVFDTRDSGTRWTRNSALIRRDYLTNTYYGMKVPTSFIDSASVTEAANIDDELIDVQQASDDFTVDAGTDLFTRSTLEALWLTGDVVQLTTTDTLPSPLALTTDYFIIIEQFKAVEDETTTTFKLAATLADALSRTPINITDAGTGTHTVTRMQEVRYTIDGSFGMNLPHEEVLKRMNTASYGKLIYSSGTWFIHSGAFRSPTTPVITEDDLRGPIQLQTLLAKSELANGVTGIYINPYDDWQPKEFPSVISSTFVAEDGETINKDIRLPFTVSTGMAQRIAKIELLRTRQQQTVILPCKLTVLDTRAGDTIQFTYDRFGFSSKEFEIIDWKFSFGEDAENPALGIDIVGREVASSDYDFSTSEEQTIDPAPNTNLPNPFIVIDPTGLTLLSGTAQLYLRLDGTVMSRIRAEWTAPADAFVTDNGDIEIQFKRSADSEWQKAPNVRGDEVFTFLLDVEDGVSYDVRVQSVNHLGVKNDTWVMETGHTVVGKTTVPTDVTELIVTARDFDVLLSWTDIPDVDLSHYEIRRGTIWETAVFETTVKGTSVVLDALAVGSNDFVVKALDTSGNESADETLGSITITAPGTPAISSVFNGSNFELSWITSKGSFAIRDYEIRRGGATYATATFVATTDSTIFITPVDWVGSEKWWVRPTDIAGNVGSASSTDLVITAPSVSNLTAQIIDNNVLLRWAGTMGSLLIADYELRKGSVFASAEVIGVNDTNFAAIFETASGSFTYWVQPRDAAGNVGTEISLTTVVDEPPDFLFKGSEDTDWVGDISESNIKKFVLGNAALASLNLTETYDEHFNVNNSFASPQAQITAGFPHWLEPSLGTASIVEELDMGTILASSRIIVSLGKTTLDGVPTTQITIGVKRLIGDPYVDFTPGLTDVFATDFQFVRTTLNITTSAGDDFLQLDTMSTVVRSKIKNDAGTVTVSANPTTVNFNVQFIDVEAITVTPQGTAARIAVVDFTDIPNPTSFDIYLFDSDGNAVTGDARWEARGF
jgi:hypothetical protein